MTVTSISQAPPVEPPLLSPDEPAPYEIVNPDGAARCLLICDHAANKIPAKLGMLGLADEDLQRHYALDIGTRDVTLQLAEKLDAPAILGTYSRLVVDLNRRLDHPTAFVTNAEGKMVAGNAGLSAQDRELRVTEIYEPYHNKISAMIEDFVARGVIPAIVSIHSFTPVFYKQVRPWEIGVLWTHDPRIPIPFMQYFRDKGFTVGDNEPYDARVLRGTTVNHHADERGLANALVEIRNDLVRTPEDITNWAEMLADSLQIVLQDEGIYSYYDGPRAPGHDPDVEHNYFNKLIERAKRGD